MIKGTFTVIIFSHLFSVAYCVDASNFPTKPLAIVGAFVLAFIFILVYYCCCGCCRRKEFNNEAAAAVDKDGEGGEEIGKQPSTTIPTAINNTPSGILSPPSNHPSHTYSFSTVPSMISPPPPFKTSMAYSNSSINSDFK
jgi:hypothetical protein